MRIRVDILFSSSQQLPIRVLQFFSDSLSELYPNFRVCVCVCKSETGTKCERDETKSNERRC